MKHANRFRRRVSMYNFEMRNFYTAFSLGSDGKTITIQDLNSKEAIYLVLKNSIISYLTNKRNILINRKEEIIDNTSLITIGDIFVGGNKFDFAALRNCYMHDMTLPDIDGDIKLWIVSEEDKQEISTRFWIKEGKYKMAYSQTGYQISIDELSLSDQAPLKTITISN